MTVMLLTAVVHLRDHKGRLVPCRNLMDNVSQVNFVTEPMSNRLKLKRKAENVPITGIGASKVFARELICVELRSRYNNYSVSVNCLIVLKITGMIPSTNVDTSSWSIPTGLQLADASFNTPDHIDMLVGMFLFFQLLKSGLRLDKNLPELRETHLGWVVAGDVGDVVPNQTYVHTATIDEVHKAIQQFWHVEELEYPSSTVTEHQEYLKQQYCDFIKEYEELGHCKEVEEDCDPPNQSRYYMPHNAILRPTSSTTKLRVVFDASAKMSPGKVSLNEALLVGGTVQNDLFTILLSFRKQNPINQIGFEF
ncbi:uncharacterized protein LOC129716981 [Wyeomyia smithii]|uniref:uncharacterized protein LOC129716981 n=1 Tax=Wyeomyia smithii TaxID=174621 RepID=UPI002467C0BA|nr:uncharacterized protein LOC129716981 [Wyeomyia smithii]